MFYLASLPLLCYNLLSVIYQEGLVLTLKERLTEDMKQALKTKDKAKLNAIRMLRGAVRNKEIETQKDLDDEGILQVLQTQIKRYRDSVEQFKDAGRDDLVEQEEAQLKALEAYLPEQLSTEEIGQLIDRVIAETGATSPKDMGKVMGAIMPQVRGKADGKMVNQLVRERLRS